MYHFAIVALMGLAIWKTVGMLLGFFGRDLTSSIKALVTLGLGVLATLALDYSLFAGWNVSVSDSNIGTIVTGLIVGTMAYVWHEVIGAIEAYGRRNRDEARAIESRSPRAA